MSIILEKKISLTENETLFFDRIQNDYFPWYYLGNSLKKGEYRSDVTSNNLVYTHACLHRHPSQEPVRGVFNSQATEEAENFFMRICRDNNVNVNIVFRIAFNATFYSPDKHDIFHTDHYFEHKIFIFYINKFVKGSTYIKNEKDEIVEIKAEQHKAVIFDNCDHAQGFCELYQRRLVLVATFN